MVFWGVTTDALLGLSVKRTSPAVVAAATSLPQAQRPRGEKEALSATSSEAVDLAKARTCPRRFASYLRLVYGWFEVMCDFLVAIFEHMLSMPAELFVHGRLPAHRSTPIYRRLCLAEGNVHRRGTDGHPSGWGAASSRGKTGGAPNMGMMFDYGMMTWTRRQHLQDRRAAIFMTWANLHIHRLAQRGCNRARTRRLWSIFHSWVDNALSGASCASKCLASKLVSRRTRTAMLQCVQRWQRVTTAVNHCRRWKLRQHKKSRIQRQHAVLEVWKTHTLAHAGAVREALKNRARQRRATCTSVLKLWSCVAAYGKCQRKQLARVIDVVKARHCALCVGAARASFSAWRLLVLKWQRPRGTRTCPALVALERAPPRCSREEGPRKKSSHWIIPYTPPPVPYTEGDTNPDMELAVEGKGFGLEVMPGAQLPVDAWCEGGAREIAVSSCSLPPALSPTPSPLSLSLSLPLSPSPSLSSLPPQLEGGPVVGERAAHFRTDGVRQGAAKGPDSVGEGTANGADGKSDRTEEQSMGCRRAEMRALTSALAEREPASRQMCAAMAASKEEVTCLRQEIEAQGAAHAAAVRGMEARIEVREVEVACMRREIEGARREAAEKCAALAVANALVVEQVKNSQK